MYTCSTQHTCVAHQNLFEIYEEDEVKNVSLNDWTARNGVSIINFLDLLLYTILLCKSIDFWLYRR